MPNLESIAAEPRSRCRAATGVLRGLHRILLLAVLSVSLALAGGARAIASVTAQTHEALVICSEGGARTIYLDEAGAPAGYVDGAGTPAGPMTDCAHCDFCLGLAALDLLAPPAVAADRGPAAAADAPALPAQEHPAQRYIRPETRGPPPGTSSDDDPAYAATHEVAAIRWSSGACPPDGRPQTAAQT